MGQPDSDALLAAWRDGDKAAGSRFIRAHYDGVARFFAFKARPEVADDLVQKTFLRCAEAASRWRGSASARAFVYGIARNVLYEHIRAQVRHRERAAPDFRTSALVDLRPGSETELRVRDEHGLLRAAMQRIPLELQLALELYYWEGLSVGQLAEVLELAPGTVKSRLHRGRRLVREALDDVSCPKEVRETVRQQLDQWIAEATEALQGD